MVNNRVEDLRALVAALLGEGCNALDKIDDSAYGRFGWVIDREGNKVELWQLPAGHKGARCNLAFESVLVPERWSDYNEPCHRHGRCGSRSL